MNQIKYHDVAIVGYGPVGAVLAILLGQQGHDVVVLERHTAPYPLPRAVHYDHEVARILQACGVAQQCSAIVEPAEVYEFQNAHRQTLLRFGRIGNGVSGWPQSSMFSQPVLEAVLFDRVASLPTVDVRRGSAVTGLERRGDVATLQTDAGPVQARFVVGCDGANSTIRSLTGISIADRAFFYDWLVVDVVFDEPRTFDPLNTQICDPARPTTVVSGGPGRRRWEFMAMPGESVEELNQELTAWRLLEPFDARPDNARLEKHAVYRFQARWVEQWRSGPVFLAGDAAHQTPPFAGQGLCAGVRDSVNLAWKLDHVLRGLADEWVLDTYGVERGPHAQAVIELAIDMGNLICVADPEAAAARDEAFLGAYDGGLTEVPPFPPFSDGIICRDTAHAGELFIQGVVEQRGVASLFDDAVGAGWRLVTTDRPSINADLAAWFEGIGGVIVAVGGDEPAVVDCNGTYGEWFASNRVTAALQRPDFVLYGTAASDAEIDHLLRSLRGSLRSAG